MILAAILMSREGGILTHPFARGFLHRCRLHLRAHIYLDLLKILLHSPYGQATIEGKPLGKSFVFRSYSPLQQIQVYPSTLPSDKNGLLCQEPPLVRLGRASTYGLICVKQTESTKIGICDALCLGGSLPHAFSDIFQCIFFWIKPKEPVPPVGRREKFGPCRRAASTKTTSATRMGEVHKNRGRILKYKRCKMVQGHD